MSELVTDYLEGDLPPVRRLSARLHLMLCSACTRYYDQMRRTVRLLRLLPPPPLLPDREDSLMRSVKPGAPPA